MTTYLVRMASGERFTWTGAVGGTNWVTTAGFLTLPGGTLLNVARIESMTPMGESAGQPIDSPQAQ